MTLNGLLASHSFAAWAEGLAIDLDRLLRAQDGDRPAFAIVALSHLSIRSASSSSHCCSAS